jgi:hypothetical protein
MVRKGFLAIFALVVGLSAAPAQTEAWRFRWQPGQVLAYRVEQTMTVTEASGENTVESKTKLNLAKRWQVTGIDAKGVATLQLSLAALRLETTTPSKETLVFDSANPDKSDPELKEQLGRFVGQPLAVLRLDTQGRVVEVKESRFGPATRFEHELPFAVVLPDVAPTAGQVWDRPYKVTLEPPAGTGEKYDAVQRCTCKAVAGPTATLAVAVMLKSLPKAVADQAPLLQFQPEGEVVFDVQAGVLRNVNLTVDKELKGYQGEGSSYHFQSTYVEEYTGNK